MLHYIKLYYTPGLVLVGIFANMLSFIIFNRKRFSKVTCTPYIASKFLTDCVFLLVLGLDWLKRVDTGINLYNTVGFCQTFTYLSSISAFLSVWLTTSMNVDRCIATTKSSLRKLCTPLRSKLLVCGLTIIAVVVYLNISILTGVVVTHIGPICAVLPLFGRRIQILGRVDILVNFLLPYVITALCCIFCTRRLYILYKQDRHMIATTGRSPVSRVRLQTYHCRDSTPTEPDADCYLELHMTRAVITSCCLYVLLTLPSHSLRSYVNISVMFSQKPYVTMSETFVLWQQLCMYAYFTHFAVNSFVYISLVPAFRSEVCSAMTFHCCHPVLNTEPTLVLSDSLRPICTSALPTCNTNIDSQSCALLCVSEQYQKHYPRDDPKDVVEQTTSAIITETH